MVTYDYVKKTLGRLLMEMEDGVERMPEATTLNSASKVKATESSASITTTSSASATILGDGGFKFGPRSIAQMNGSSELPPLKYELRQVAELAIQLSMQDFAMFEVGRNRARQAQLVKAGASRTMLSKHLAQSDGYAHAFDAVPWVNNDYSWDWQRIYPITLAIDEAATRLGYADNIIWGGAWDRRLSDFGGSAAAYMKEVEAYTKRHAGKDFIDGPHYQWAD